MFRAYQSLTPVSNVYLGRRWDQQFYEHHKKKMSLAKPVVDNKPPKTYVHLHVKLNKLQMDGDRLAIVERDNENLLNKMAHIMKTGGHVDNKRKDYKQKSLNKVKRHRDLLRITHENFAILKRLNAVEPFHNHLQWQDDWNVNQKYMAKIEKFPQYWRNKHLDPYDVHKEQIAAANKRIRNRLLREEQQIRNGDTGTKVSDHASPHPRPLSPRASSNHPTEKTP